MVESNLANTIDGFLKKEFSQYQYTKGYWFKYKNQQLELDFLIPGLKVAIEVQGQQHYFFNNLFHKTNNDLRKQKYRDSLKAEWCAEKGFTLVEFPYDSLPSNSEEFKEIILQKVKEACSGS